ncbi:hypothetical protein CPAR01_12716 [Colletotrichum paranaense]|uniref:Uncharacterized protein n=1 Tax=Colletotrichum paranaense TaxID=1914294 RepID=A0ABQ9S7I8_9PEZI|nr:uncharacterized protein CPAR01_12716 [Colletotrichum paranaense]KAK1528158.1 hypothetical protein CPAR01_12716 [Colletotrichum paranaense]
MINTTTAARCRRPSGDARWVTPAQTDLFLCSVFSVLSHFRTFLDIDLSLFISLSTGRVEIRFTMAQWNAVTAFRASRAECLSVVQPRPWNHCCIYTHTHTHKRPRFWTTKTVSSGWIKRGGGRRAEWQPSLPRSRYGTQALSPSPQGEFSSFYFWNSQYCYFLQGVGDLGKAVHAFWEDERLRPVDMYIHGLDGRLGSRRTARACVGWVQEYGGHVANVPLECIARNKQTRCSSPFTS